MNQDFINKAINDINHELYTELFHKQQFEDCARLLCSSLTENTLDNYLHVDYLRYGFDVLEVKHKESKETLKLRLTLTPEEIKVNLIKQ